jgi:hypothetical protein
MWVCGGGGGVPDWSNCPPFLFLQAVCNTLKVEAYPAVYLGTAGSFASLNPSNPEIKPYPGGRNREPQHIVEWIGEELSV